MTTHARTRIKICGVRDTETAFAAIEAGADALGFVFHPESPRFIEPADAWEIVQQLPPFVTTVGLTVNLSVNRFADTEATCPTDYSQLHGDESVETVQRCGPRVIKAIRFDASTIEKAIAQWCDVEEVDAILIDGSTGGMGVALEWPRLAPFVRDVPKPIILAGGLTPENVADAIRAVAPFAVDVSSGVERERGQKDAKLIRAFCDAVRKAEIRPNS